MKNTAIIIPSRLEAKRFPNKPLALINGLPMVVHVLNRALESKVGDVYVATPDKEIFDLIKKNGGEAILTKSNHLSGSDRVYEAYSKIIKHNVDLIINLQGDMPNIKPNSIIKLEKLMRSSSCAIGTLASLISEKEEIKDANVVKVQLNQNLTNHNFLEAKDFFRLKKNLKNEAIYHHIGIYAFTRDALKKYVNHERSNLEIERNLEQMRAIENGILIKVALINSSPLGVDTELDLKQVIKEMNLK